jgi:alpha-glucuronidase
MNHQTRQLLLMNMQTAMMQTLTAANTNAANNAQLMQTMLSMMTGGGAAPAQYASPYGMPYGTPYGQAPMGYPYAAYGQPPQAEPMMPV